MNRYELRELHELDGGVTIVMERCDNGKYITYASHKNEIESLHARLKELESKQKDLVNRMTNLVNKYNGDQCHSTVDSFIEELSQEPVEFKVVCELGDGRNFITGREYNYEIDSSHESIRIFVGKYDGMYCWAAKKIANNEVIEKYKANDLYGNTIGIFHIK